MKYKVGDRVRIKSLDWYNENKDDNREIRFENGIFTTLKSTFLGQIMTIEEITLEKQYILMEDRYKTLWTDEMIECKVEEETKPQYEDEIELIGYSSPKQFLCPIGYEFRDENDNIINAQKIVLKKKKPKYPKTYEECCKIMDIDTGFLLTSYDLDFWKGHLLTSMQKLLICRNAYWKIAGEEMGLGKPWEPNDADYVTGRYCIFVHQGNIICSTPAEDCPLTFPTAEMRDAFYENFKELIEFCKELL